MIPQDRSVQWREQRDGSYFSQIPRNDYFCFLRGGRGQTPLPRETGTVLGNPSWSQQQPFSSKLLSLGLEFLAIKSLKRF